MPDLRLLEIWIYPVKSLGGLRLKSSSVLEKGLRFDRRWMLVDEDGNFMTQRTCSAMALFKLTLGKDHFTIDHEGQSIQLSFLHSVIGLPVETKVFDDPVTVYEVSEAHSDWFSQETQQKV